MEEHVVLVDADGNDVGTAEKLKTHRDGRLHRAFSIFVFNSQGELLLQKRERTKYHSGGLWTNTCCSHPRPGERHDRAAHRRLKEEMGFDCALEEVFRFTYHTRLENDLFEHEYDHVFIGRYDGVPTPDPQEVEDWKWMAVEALKRDIHARPACYTYWFTISFQRVVATYRKRHP